MSEKTTSSSRSTTFAADAAGAFLANPDEAPDIATLETDALAWLFETFDAAWSERSDTAGDDSPIWQGEESYISDVEVSSAQKGFGFVAADDDDRDAGPFFEDGGARLYVTPSGSGDGGGDLVTQAAQAANNLIVGDDGGSDWLEGTSEADDIYGMGGNDVLIGNRGSDRLFGGDGTDSLFGGRGHDMFWGAEGNDHIEGGRGEDTLYGQEDNDVLLGGLHDDELYGGSGADHLGGGAGDDLIDGGSGFDMATYALAENGVVVNLDMNGPQDTGEGWDELIDIEGITGSLFDDALTGNAGGNRLEGLAGDDTLRGWKGNDTMFGGEGNDVLDGGEGNDVFDGGAGIDTARFNSATSGVVVDLHLNGPQNTGQGIDTFIDMEGITGSHFGDFLRGTNGYNKFTGNGGNDWMWGAGGGDVLRGMDGNDMLHGGSGNDFLTGGSGADAFVYASVFGNTGDDTIEDFQDGTDLVFVEIAFGISGWDQVTIGTDADGDAVASFDGFFGGSITFEGVSENLIGEEDFLFI